MLQLSCDMTIGDYRFNFVNEVEITSTWENLTDLATIKIPKALTLKRDGLVDNVITAGPDALWQRGNPVKISLGYNGIMDERFTGVITRIRPNRPLEFDCEDLMWRLKQVTIKKKFFPDATLNDIISYIIPFAEAQFGEKIPFSVEHLSVSNFIIEQGTIAQVLNFFKTEFNLSVYFQNGSLYVGFAYKLSSIADFALNELKQFTFQENIIDYNNLDFVRLEDQNLRVTAINILKNNTRNQIEVGDTFGDQRTIYFYNLSEADVKRLATEQLEKLKYTGFRGSFTTFLKPYVKHGDAIKLVDPLIPDRNGVYLVRKVVTTFGMNGGRQEITLDRKIA